MSDPVFAYGHDGYRDGVFPAIVDIVSGWDSGIAGLRSPLTQYSSGDVVTLDGTEGRHAVTVTRIAVGDSLVLVDGRGYWAACTVRETPSKSQLVARVEECGHTALPTPPVTVVQALPKSDRSELAVDLACQAGADAIVPWSASRSIARWKGKEKKAAMKWVDAAIASSKQSRRARFPRIGHVSSTEDVVTAISHVTKSGGLVIVLEESESVSLTALSDEVGQASQMMVIVGPEGGIAPDEHDAFVMAGARSVVLGPEVLRTATAASVALGALGVLTRRWSRA